MASETELELDDEVARAIEKKPVWPYFLLLGILVLGGVGGGWYWSSRPDPKLIFVAVDIGGFWWEGSAASAVVTDRFAARLEELGFTPVRSGDPEVIELLESAESPDDARRKLGAGFLVTGRLVPELIEHPVEGGYFEARTQGEVSVRYLDEQPIRAGTVDGWSGAKKRDQASKMLGDSVADRVFDHAMAALMAHPVLQGILTGPDAVERGKLQRAKGYVEFRAKRLKAAKEKYTALARERKAGERGGHDHRYHGSFDSEDTLCGVGASGFLSRRSRIKPFFSPERNDLMYYRELDELLWVGFDGKTSSVMRGYNLYSYPSASPDGSTVVYIEDMFGWAKTITAVQGKGSPRRVRVDPKHRFQQPRVAPNGKLAAVYDKPCRKCPPNLLVIDLVNGKTSYLLDASRGNVEGFDWLSPTRLLVVFEPFAPPPSQVETDEAGLEMLQATQAEPNGLFVVDLSAKAPELERVYEASEGERFTWARVSRDGRFVVLPRVGQGGAGLALFAVQEAKLEIFAVGGTAEMPELAPDGKGAVFAQRGEIVHFDFASRKVTVLTKNAVRDRYPVFSIDGKRIYYESLDDDPNFSRSRNVSVISSVAVP